MMQFIVFSGEKSEMESLGAWLTKQGESVVTPSTLQINSNWIEMASQIAIAVIGSSALAVFIGEYIKSNRIDLDFSDEKGTFKVSCRKGSLDKVMQMYKDYKASRAIESELLKGEETDGD